MSDKWTANQRRFIDWRTLPTAERVPGSQEELAVELRVSARTLHRWSQIDGFDDEVRRLVMLSMGRALPNVAGATSRAAIDGEAQDRRLYFELMGMLKRGEAVSVTTNVSVTDNKLYATVSPDDWPGPNNPGVPPAPVAG